MNYGNGMNTRVQLLEMISKNQIFRGFSPLERKLILACEYARLYPSTDVQGCDVIEMLLLRRE